MKKIVAIILLVAAAITVHAQEVEVGKTTYYLVRHAEKVITSNPNPELTAIGMARAEKWAEILSSIEIDAVYSTRFIRTENTAKPTAVKSKLTIQYYHPTKIDFEKFLGETSGKNVLIVGHSNTIPGFVNRLIGEPKYSDMAHNDNGSLYIVEIIGDTVFDSVLHIN